MSSKLVLQDLVDLLAKKSKITKKEADSFFREFFQLILERIFDNDSVKVKDFGTFKLVSVNSRESVDVNTGEKIEIRAHYKLSFVPDKTLKNLVNKPFSQFETIMLEEDFELDSSTQESATKNNNIVKEEASEDEYIVDIPSEMMPEGILDEEESVAKDEDEESIVLPSVEMKTPESLDNIEEEKVEETTTNDPPKIQYPSYGQSFVYTYVSSADRKDEDNNTVTLTVPAVVPSIPQEEKAVVSEPVRNKEKVTVESKIQVEEKKVDLVLDDEDLIDLSDEDEDLYEDEDVVVDESEGEDLSEEKSIVEDRTETSTEKTELLDDSVASDDAPKNKHYIEPIAPTETSILGDVLADSDIEIEEDIIVSIPIKKDEPVTELLSNDDAKIEEVSQKINEWSPRRVDETTDAFVGKKQYSIDDPERPLFPDEDSAENSTDVADGGLDVSAIEGQEGRVSNEAANFVGNNRPTEIRSVTNTETIDDMDLPYHEYYAPSRWDKIKKMLPWIIIGAGILGVVVYNAVLLFDVKYDFEDRLNRVTLTTSDTLPMLDELETEIIDSATTGIISDSSVLKIAEKKPASESIANNTVNDTASLTQPDRKISDHLKIDIINKAQYYLQKYPPKKKETPVLSEKENVAEKANPQVTAQQQKFKPTFDTIRRGITLRNLAAKHYGNGDYWVYIYQANRNKIRNPNNVPIGTKLSIPSLTDFGISNQNDPREIQKAKNVAERILRY